MWVAMPLVRLPLEAEVAATLEHDFFPRTLSLMLHELPPVVASCRYCPVLFIASPEIPRTANHQFLDKMAKEIDA
jgi:hypothetical protein